MKLVTLARLATTLTVPFISITNAAPATNLQYHAQRDFGHGTWDLGGGASAVWMCNPVTKDPHLCTVAVLTGDPFASDHSYIATVFLYNNLCEEQYVDEGVSETQLKSGYTFTSKNMPHPVELTFPKSLTIDLIRHPKLDAHMIEMLPLGIQLKYGDYQGDPFQNNGYQPPQKSLVAYPAMNNRQAWYVLSLPFKC